MPTGPSTWAIPAGGTYLGLTTRHGTQGTRNSPQEGHHPDRTGADVPDEEPPANGSRVSCGRTANAAAPAATGSVQGRVPHGSTSSRMSNRQKADPLSPAPVRMSVADFAEAGMSYRRGRQGRDWIEQDQDVVGRVERFREAFVSLPVEIVDCEGNAAS